MHQNGLNIRYLGYVAEVIKDKDLAHMKTIFEREVIVRCAKHLLNKYVRECESPELLSAIISHFFNCLLAPREF